MFKSLSKDAKFQSKAKEQESVGAHNLRERIYKAKKEY